MRLRREKQTGKRSEDAAIKLVLRIPLSSIHDSALFRGSLEYRFARSR